MYSNRNEKRIINLLLQIDLVYSAFLIVIDLYILSQWVLKVGSCFWLSITLIVHRTLACWRCLITADSWTGSLDRWGVMALWLFGNDITSDASDWDVNVIVWISFWQIWQIRHPWFIRSEYLIQFPFTGIILVFRPYRVSELAPDDMLMKLCGVIIADHYLFEVLVELWRVRFHGLTGKTRITIFGYRMLFAELLELLRQISLVSNRFLSVGFTHWFAYQLVVLAPFLSEGLEAYWAFFTMWKSWEIQKLLLVDKLFFALIFWSLVLHSAPLIGVLTSAHAGSFKIILWVPHHCSQVWPYVLYHWFVICYSYVTLRQHCGEI